MRSDLQEEAAKLAWKILYYAYGPRSHVSRQPTPASPTIDGFLRRLQRAAGPYAAERDANDDQFPLGDESTLAADLGRFIGTISRPGAVFDRGCRDSAVGIAECLMKYEGCEIARGLKMADFKKELRNFVLTRSTPLIETTSHFSKLLERYWTYTGNFSAAERKFKKVHLWRHVVRKNDLQVTIEQLVPR